MAVELNFNRADNSIPWGFRLTGGADLDMPLTVIKVAENSIAEEAGMKLGDLLVRIGDTPTAGLTHLQVHDLIKEAGNTFAAAVIRGDLPAHITETEQTIDSETTQNGISQSVQINIKANVVDTTQIVVESGEVVGQNIRINGSVVSDQDEQNVEITISKEEMLAEEEQNVEFTITREEKLSEEVTVEKSSQETRSEITESQAIQIKDELSLSLEKMMQPPECILDSEVLKVINEQQQDIKKDQAKIEKRWTTFLQTPDRPKPKIKQKEDDEQKKSTTNETYEEHVLLTRLLGLVQEPPYRVIIQKQKKKRDAEKAAMLSSEASKDTTPIPTEMMIETPEVAEEEQEEKKEDEHEEVNEEGAVTEECEQPEEPVISEVEMSLEEQLAAIQKQLLALSQLPAAIQQTLDVVTQQLTKIVGPVNDPNTEENEADEYAQQDALDESEQETDFEERTGDLETLEEVSESGFDRDSQQGEGDQDTERLAEESEFNKPEPELEMLEVTPEPEDDPNLTEEEREARRLERAKMDKQQKETPVNPILSDLRQRRIKTGDYPLTPLQRPICLPGGRKWHAPDDAQPSLSPRHHDMSDEQIAETISAQTEIAHWNDIWPWGDRLGRKIYRDANTHLVPSKATESNKINFLKYQPPPKSLDHLKHSEVFRLVHDMDQPVRGVGARPGKAMAEEDYYAQARSGQEGQMKG